MKTIGNVKKDGQVRAVASGNLTDGSTVVVNSDGTVSVVSETSVTQAAGSPTVFETASSTGISATFDSNSNKVVIAYTDNGNSFQGTAVVGTVSNTSITFGTPVVFNAGSTKYSSATFDSNSNKVVIAYRDDGANDHGYAIVGTVSGTSISFGSEVIFNASTMTSALSATFDSSSNKIVIAYQDKGNADYGTAIVGTVSGTSISFGSEVVFESAQTEDISATFDSNSNKIVIAYRDSGNTGDGTAIVGTVSGTSISFGSATVFDTASTEKISIAYDTNAQKVVITYKDGGNSNYGTAIVGTVSGTSISFGTEVVFESSFTESAKAIYDTTAQKIVIAYYDSNNSEYGTVISGTVSGTSISFDSATVFESAAVDNIGVAYDSNANKVVVAYKDKGNSNYGTSAVFQTGYTSTNLTTENFLGFSDGVYTQPTANIGDEVEYVSNGSGQALAYDTTNDKVVIAYRDNSNNYGKARVGTVDGATITLGSAATFESATINAGSLGIAFDANAGKVLLAYQDQGNNNYGTAIVGTVSGTSISFGTPNVFESAQSNYMTPVYDANAQKVVIYYGDVDNSTSLTAVVATISGTGVSFGSPVVVNSGATYNYGAGYDSSAQKTVVVFEDRASTTGKAAVGTVSGTSISFGSTATFTSNQPTANRVVYDTNANKSVILFSDTSDSSKGKSVVGTVSGTSISFGSVVVFNDAITYSLCGTYNLDENEVIVSFVDNGNSQYGTYVAGTVSGTSISFSSEVVYEQETVNSVGGQSAIYDPDQSRSVFGYKDNSDNSLKLRSVNASSNPQTGPSPVATVLSSCSIARNQTSLTPGQTYFVTPAGALSTTAGSPSVTAGTAISSTELIVKG